MTNNNDQSEIQQSNSICGVLGKLKDGYKGLDIKEKLALYIVAGCFVSTASVITIACLSESPKIPYVESFFGYKVDKRAIDMLNIIADFYDGVPIKADMKPDGGIDLSAESNLDQRTGGCLLPTYRNADTGENYYITMDEAKALFERTFRLNVVGNNNQKMPGSYCKRNR